MKILIMIPTFNERENIAALIKRIFDLALPDPQILVVDDNSPDGTGQIVQDLIRDFSSLHLIKRTGPAGRGLAGREGYLYALESGADYVIEMDADFSHDPKYIPEMLQAINRCDMVIGSRFVSGGLDADRPLLRRWLTVAANAYARNILGLKILDTNSGFRCFSREALIRINCARLRSRGPSIVHEVLFRAFEAGLRIQEIPISFVDRKKGNSKLSLARLAVGYFWILLLGLRLWAGQRTRSSAEE